MKAGIERDFSHVPRIILKSNNAISKYKLIKVMLLIKKLSFSIDVSHCET
jgi:hypothetical protein